MGATAEAIASLLPEFAPGRVEEQLSGLGRRYLERFAAGEAADHLRALARLSPERPVEAIVSGDPETGLRCTVLAFDYPSEFSYITGVLSSMGFDILEGDVFTFGLVGRNRGNARDVMQRKPDRRKIIDSFAGRVKRELWSDDWPEALAERLERVVLILERGGADSQARTKRAVAELAASALEEIGAPDRTLLYPVLIEVEDKSPDLVRLRVESEDTPFFLFAFSAALSLQGVSIERVTIRTRGSRIEDAFEFADASGGAIDDPVRIDRIKLSVLLTKQFTSFLGGAGDPRAAILRFENLVAEVLAVPEQGRWLEMLSSGKVMGDLARLLGASTFLWEDFIRQQYETLLPMLGPRAEGGGFSEPLDTLPRRLGSALEGSALEGSGSGSGSEEAFVAALNAFKDREILLYDMDHILGPRADFLTLSRRLTVLAELVVDAASSYAYRALARRFGEPLTAAGFPAKFAVMGLGKMGGAALGYASDIELLFVYDDSGRTAGPKVVENAEFFGALVRSVQGYVRAKREGIFQIDLRLRPYGASGPLACSLESFCTYYAPGGPAHSYERLALVRLRTVGGDGTLGERVERLRDELVYSAKGFDIVEFRELRERQLREKTKTGRPNAKFGSGALVDLEYAVQILQIRHGATDRRLRTPRIHEAIGELASIALLGEEEARELAADYDFLRMLINGLRMLRGSALDLFLPEDGSEEYSHLARRIGYVAEGDLSPARRLSLEFEARTADVRAFADRHFSGEDHYTVRPTNAADLVLSGASNDAERDSILSSKGFKNPARAFVNLRNIAGTGADSRESLDASSPRRLRFARLAILACDILSQRPDPDMALNNWERFVDSVPDPASHLAQMLAQPKRLEILLDILSTSQFLADTLVMEPALLDYVSDPRTLRSRRTNGDIAFELSGLSRASSEAEEWKDGLRAFRRKEILRIGARDICLGTRTVLVMEELSSLADCMIEAALGRIRHAALEEGRSPVPRFCVLAFGKLGGRELNYSSDIDLLGLWEASEGGQEGEETATSMMEKLRSDLSDHTAGGYAYRVDLRLRPYGSSGQLVYELGALLRYYAEPAALWEQQALLKARPVAGDLELGARFLESARGTLVARRDPDRVVASIDSLRREAIRDLSRGMGGGRDVKTGLGGIRDVEFLVQGLQLIHAHSAPGLLRANSLEGLSALEEAGILPAEVSGRLAEDYVFLRRVEHFLQIYEDRQTHRLPKDPEQVLALARRMLGAKATVEQFRSALDLRFENVHSEYRKFIEGAYRDGPS
jgi:glutamate-ammonia-ligase adenylyltransferase